MKTINIIPCKGTLKGWFGNGIKWNFTKFLIDASRKPIMRFSPATKPESIEKDVNVLLKLE